MKCPLCQVEININNPESDHQVNDHFDLTFCCFDHSKQYTLNYLQENEGKYSEKEKEEILEKV